MHLRTLLAVISISSAALAYPTPAVFVPRAESAKPLETTVYLFDAFGLEAPYIHTPWRGIQAGILPHWKLVDGVKFGGLEAGIDTFRLGTDNWAGGFKWVLNGKLSFVEEGLYWPSFAVGLMQFSWQREDSLDLVYGVATKTSPVGTFNAGYVHSFGKGFVGTFPFSANHKGSLLTSYQTPQVSVKDILFNLAVEMFGGGSELSSINTGIQGQLGWFSFGFGTYHLVNVPGNGFWTNVVVITGG